MNLIGYRTAPCLADGDRLESAEPAHDIAAAHGLE